MSKHEALIQARTNEELLNDWKLLDSMTNDKGATADQAKVRGWLMAEIEKRWPKEFDQWIENCEVDDNILNYITL